MCAKVRIYCKHKPSVRTAHPEPDFRSDPELFLPSGPKIFQTGSSSFPFPVAPMPTSANSCVPRCVYTVNTRLLSGLHIRNRIFAQIQNFFAILTRNFPNRIQFLPFPGCSYANFCLLMCAKVCIRVHSRFPSGFHIQNRIFAQIRNFFAIRTRNFPNRIQFLPFSGCSYANFCILMCAKVDTVNKRLQSGDCTSGNGFLPRSGTFPLSDADPELTSLLSLL
jgi:hypothetical protein